MKTMKKGMKPGDMFNAHKKTAMKKRQKKVSTNNFSPENYGKSMASAVKNTKVFGMPSKPASSKVAMAKKKRGMKCKRHKKMACKHC